ncbi:TonB-dependent receptor plug domain-containing protein [Crenothrix sp.]|uniref:TonB-dependent receptor plug domain-containing protein n=1 Tax=Crenothrix sp. TaxID=3100433 RepID=UPI00374D9D8D
MQLRKFFVSPLLLIISSPTAYAAQVAQQVETLPTLTITADAPFTEQDPYNTATLTRVPYKELIQSGKRDIAGILQGYTGVAAGSVSRGYPARLSIRGSAGALGMVTVDDIPLMGVTHNLINLAAFTSESLESMDIVRGPGAYRYANTALGGVIRLSTRDNKDTNAFFRMEGGSFDTISETAGASAAGNLGRATVTLNRDDILTGSNISDPALGNRENDGARSTMAIGRYTLYPTDNLELNGTLLYNKGHSDLDGYKYFPQLSFLGATDNTRAFASTDTWLAQQTAVLTVSPHWQSSLKLGLSQQALNVRLAIARPLGDTLYVPFEFTNRLLLANWRNQHDYEWGAGDSNRLSLHWGGAVQEETGDGSFIFNLIQRQRSSPINHQRTTSTGFAGADFTLGQWSASAGVRVNHYNDFGTHPNYYFGLGWQVLPQLKLRGTAGVGFRVPSINEMWTPMLGNAQLKPERAVSGELGLDWQPLDKLSITLTGFYTRYHNLIASLPEIPVIAPINADRVRVQGLEMAWRYAILANASLGTDYTYTDSHNEQTGHNLINTPPHSARFFGDWQASQLPVTLHLEGIYTGGWQWQTPQDTSVGVDDSFRVNLQMSYSIQQNAQVYIRGENLNNNRNPMIPTFGSPGVAVYGGIKLSLF